MALQAFLQVGLSFAEIGLFENQVLKARRRFYLPQEPLGNSLKKFWQEHGQPKSLTVSSRYLEKILDAKLGGTVAQVVTAGFETWPILRQPILPDHFDLKPFRQEALASKDLIFGLSERVSSDGKIIKALELSELEQLNVKLKALSVKRVCINLLFANLNPEHQQQAAQYFEEQGFEVFAAPRDSDSNDEMPAWRKNVINACLSGAFNEHSEDLLKTLESSDVEFVFLNHRTEPFRKDKNQIVGSLFAWISALENDFKNTFKDQATHLLYLGLEDWHLISLKEHSAHWQSPWGRIESQTVHSSKLKIQPTLEITTGFFGGVSFSQHELGFEPGPLCFGRALKPTVFDLLNYQFKLPLAQIQEKGVLKLKDQFTALIKNVPELEKFSAEKLSQTLMNHVVARLCSESQFRANAPIEKLMVTGFFASSLFPLIEKKWTGASVQLDSLAMDRDLLALHHARGF
jgi:hypothetical protein